MGAHYSQLVFQPGETASYTPEQLVGLEWIEDPIMTGPSTPTKSGGSDASVAPSQRRIPTKFYEWKGRNNETAFFTILYSGGNGEDLGTTQTWIQTLRDALHVNVMCYEYTGYGINRAGRPSEKQFYEDILVVFNHLTNVKKIPSDRIILFGKSIGSGPTVHLASALYYEASPSRSLTKSLGRKLSKKMMSPESKEGAFKGFAGLILQSPMTSVLDIHPEIKNALLTDMFENAKKINKIKCSIFIIHGTKDEMIPSRHSKKLLRYVSDGMAYKHLEFEDAGHFNIESDYSDEYLDELVDFVNSLMPSEVLDEKRKTLTQVPAEFCNSPIQIISNWLQTINLTKYRDAFLGAGYYDLLSISSIDLTDLEIMGITDPKERDAIIQAILELKTRNRGSLEDPNLKPRSFSAPVTKGESNQSSPVLRINSLPISPSQEGAETPDSPDIDSNSKKMSIDRTRYLSFSEDLAPLTAEELEELKRERKNSKPPLPIASVFSPDSHLKPGSNVASSPTSSEGWKNIDAMIDDLARPSAATKVEVTNASTPNRERKVLKSSKSIQQGENPEREVRNLKTKLQLLERIVISQNELITQLNNKLLEAQKLVFAQEDTMRKMTTDLNVAKLQLTLLGGVPIGSSSEENSTSPNGKNPESKDTNRVQENDGTDHHAAFEEYYGELEKEFSQLGSPR